MGDFDLRYLFPDTLGYSSADEENDNLDNIRLYKSQAIRIRANLVGRKREAYEPRMISLGSFHVGESHLDHCEEIKRQLPRCIFPYRIRYFNDLVGSMNSDQIITRIKEWYGIPESDDDGGRWGWMMARDGIFLLQCLREISHISDDQEVLILGKIKLIIAEVNDFSDLENSVTDELREQLHALRAWEVQEDIMKLQNQIPLFALRVIVRWERLSYQDMKQKILQRTEHRGENLKMLEDIKLHARTGTKHSLTSILRRAWHSLSPFPDMYVNDDSLILPGENAHILGFVYANILGEGADDNQRNGEKKKKRILPGRAVDLDNKGVNFAALEEPLHRIHFDGNTWTFHLPRIEITERTDAVMRNLVAFELFGRQGQTKPIKRYVELMDQLINTAEDVEVLKRCGIIHHDLGSDQEVADIWNKMRQGHDQKGKYGPIDTAIDEVITFYGSYRILYAEGMKKYFSKPWLVVSSIAGFIIVVTAILQTIFSGLQLHR